MPALQCSIFTGGEDMGTTIAAYSGGALPAAIGIVRLSGPQALDILAKIFVPRSGISITNCISGKLYYGKLSDSNENTIDLCMAAAFRGPKSYTGEDMAEIYCHGSRAVVDEALRHAFCLGALPAEAGEFTRRAFLAGKLDLTEAEAVADLIDSTSPLAARAAAAQLEGAVGGRIAAIRQEISGLLAHFYAACDYTDEDIQPFEQRQAATTIAHCAAQLEQLHQSFERGRLLKDGIPVALVGRPNAGKSSLFNALAGYDRAIVTEEAGTTRDVLDLRINCGGAPVRLLDTAGIRQAQGRVEEIGIQRAREALDNSQAVIALVDCSCPATAEDVEVLRLAAQKEKRLLVFSKVDLAPPAMIKSRVDELRALGLEDLLPQLRIIKGGQDLEPVDEHLLPYNAQRDSRMRQLLEQQGIQAPDDESCAFGVAFSSRQEQEAFEAGLPTRPFDELCAVSATTGRGIGQLEEWLGGLVPPPGDDPIITSGRQAALMASAAADLRAAAESLDRGLTPDAFLSDAERALNTLGQITGQTASADIAHEIFSRFCVGK